MSDHTSIPSWERHAWKRDTGWWDTLVVDKEALKEQVADVFEWLEGEAPDPLEHDYVLYTDGSGCKHGWGGYAAVIEKIDRVGEYREVVDTDVIVTATYGSTVQRTELSAFLDGMQKILYQRVEELQAEAEFDDELKYILGSQGALNQLRGPDRVSVLWYTDRRNLAMSLLYDENGDPLQSRNSDKDLWFRWSFMAKHVCVTPMFYGRNQIPGQKICDALASEARAALKDIETALASEAAFIHPTEKWQKEKPQKVLF